MGEERPRCRHCGILAATRPRELCYRCFGNLAIRAQYANQYDVARASLPRCRHCQVRAGRKWQRGLCKPCHRDLEIRGQYQTSFSLLTRAERARLSRRKPSEYQGSSKEPAEATPAPPGSAEKEAVMAERYRLGQSLFHKDDGPPPDPLEPGERERRSYRGGAQSERRHRAHLEV